jgi:hypothetical protein
VPILIVLPICGSDWGGTEPRRILVPLDGSDFAAEVLQPATELAASLGTAEIMLLTVGEPTVGTYPDAEVPFGSHPVRASTAHRVPENVADRLPSSARVSVTRRVACGDLDAALTIASNARMSATIHRCPDT